MKQKNKVDGEIERKYLGEKICYNTFGCGFNSGTCSTFGAENTQGVINVYVVSVLMQEE